MDLRGLDQAVFSPQAHGHVGHIRWKPMGERWRPRTIQALLWDKKMPRPWDTHCRTNKLPVKQTVIIWQTNNQLMISIIWQIYFKPDSCVLKYIYFISEHIKKHFLKNRMVFQISTEWFISRLKKKINPLSIHLIFISTAFSNTRVLKNSWLCYALLN